MTDDYQNRKYLSVSEAANYTGLTVRDIHGLVKDGKMIAFKSTSGQYRFQLDNIHPWRRQKKVSVKKETIITVKNTTQKIICADARKLSVIPDNSVHLAVTSPPYFNTKMYSAQCDSDLGNIHDVDAWLQSIKAVWCETLRVLQPGRKFFLNIMNLPVRENKSFRTLNLVGKSIDLCESVGFIFKRDIVWHKTNGVRAHFGTYPYPGGILINNMHEFILEFEKPAGKPGKKYAHVTTAQKEQSKLDKEFWLSLKNSDVWLMKPEKSGVNREHAAPFPLELPTRLIRAFSYVGETVFDPFLGSGTTLIAAAEIGRNGIGCEINPEFCQMAVRRIRNEGNM